MPPEPLVSIVLPVFNAGATLRPAVESIRTQTYARWELLVVDDGSADETSAIVQEFAGADPRIRLLCRPRAGLVASLNAGLAAAQGSLIARMDADDLAHPERIAAQVAFLGANPDVGLVGSLVEFGGDPVANAGYALHVEWINSLVTPEQIALNRFVESPFAHPSVVFRREVVERHGGYAEPDGPEDYELWLRWIDGGVRMAKVPRVLLRWNDSPRRLSRTDPRCGVDAFFRVKARWLAREVARIERDRLQASGETPRSVWIWGAGRPTRKRAAHLETAGLRIAGYIDVDAKKATVAIGGTGAPVIAPAQLPTQRDIFVLGYVSSRGARELIRAELRRRGYIEGRDFLMCA